MRSNTPRTHIWTETPLAEIWHQLRYLEIERNVSGLLTGSIRSNRAHLRSASQEVEEEAFEIASCIRQADEYFAASEQVGLVTRPLLQFYGIQSLSKALIVASNPSARLSHFKYHGLSTRSSTAASESDRLQLDSYSANSDKWRLEQEFAITNDGVFPRLAEAAGEIAPSKGLVIRFKELIRIVPELTRLFARHYSEPSHCFYLSGQPIFTEGGNLQICFDSHENLDDLLSVFPEFSTDYHRIEDRSEPTFESIAHVRSLPTFAAIEQGTFVGRYWIRPHRIGIHSYLTVLYAAMFILSDIVRYKPAFWMRTVNGTDTGSISIVEALCHLVKRRFPNNVLECIWQERFTYGGPSYLS